jgi:L-cysteate sulfo-lyase
VTSTAASPSPSHRIALGSWPTPIEPAPRLAEALGLNSKDLWIKRDDLNGLGGGGNKVRKLEWTVGTAIAGGADTLVTTGAPQSNHARLTAAAGARLGLHVVLVFPGEYGQSRSGNIALDGLFGTRIHWAGDVDHDQLTQVAANITNQLRHDGARPELIPFGGSNATGAHGYIEAGRELLAQLPDFDTAVVALGSGGTMAGLVASLGPGKVFGVHTGALDNPAPVVAELASQTSQTRITTEQLHIRDDQVGAGYSHLTEQAAAALELTAHTEGIVLDPIYTARAMAGLIAAVHDGDITPGTKTVFFHTGGLPGLFGHPDAVNRAEQALGEYPASHALDGEDGRL